MAGKVPHERLYLLASLKTQMGMLTSVLKDSLVNTEITFGEDSVEVAKVKRAMRDLSKVQERTFRALEIEHDALHAAGLLSEE